MDSGRDDFAATRVPHAVAALQRRIRPEPESRELLRIAIEALVTKLPTDNVMMMPAPVVDEMPLAA